MADLLRQPRWLAGFGTMICGQLLSAWVIGHIILAVAEPLLATNLLIALGLAWRLCGQRLKASEIAGALVLLTGVVALAVAQSVSSDHDTIGSPRYWPYCGGAAAVLAAIAAAEPVCGMLLGSIVFREKVPASPSMITLQGAGLVALVAGVVTVARAPALASIHAARRRDH